MFWNIIVRTLAVLLIWIGWLVVGSGVLFFTVRNEPRKRNPIAVFFAILLWPIVLASLIVGWFRRVSGW
jgi:hypothetical protein